MLILSTVNPVESKFGSARRGRDRGSTLSFTRYHRVNPKHPKEIDPGTFRLVRLVKKDLKIELLS